MPTQESEAVSKDDLLSFKATGRVVLPDALTEEFELMRGQLKEPFTTDVARRICQKSGSHLIKLVSPRIDGEHAVLRFDDPASNRRSALLPSVNAPDIPFCKVVFRPLEVFGHSTMSVVDHILNPEAHSEPVLAAFSMVFGADILETMQKALCAHTAPLKLGAGEFPIIFIPRPGGGDLQITPVSPAAAFTGIKRVTDHYFQKAQPDGPRPPRGRWIKQAVSSKPQNISGAIGGPRVRFLATMPPAMSQGEAELYRYVHGGSVPSWREEEVAVWVLRYGDMLEADASFNNRDTRAALDRTADRLIRDAIEFIDNLLADAREFANRHGIDHELPADGPSVPQVLIRRKWGKEQNLDRARKALTSPHFEDRLRKTRNTVESQA